MHWGLLHASRFSLCIQISHSELPSRFPIEIPLMSHPDPSCMKIRIKALRASRAPSFSLPTPRPGKPNVLPPRAGPLCPTGGSQNEKRKLRCASGRSPEGEARETAREARAEPAIPMPPPEDVFPMRKERLRGTPTRRLRPAPFFGVLFAGLSPWGSSRA